MTDIQKEALELADFWEDFLAWSRGVGLYADHIGDYPRAKPGEIGLKRERTIAILRIMGSGAKPATNKPPPFGAWGAEPWWPEWMP